MHNTVQFLHTKKISEDIGFKSKNFTEKRQISETAFFSKIMENQQPGEMWLYKA